VDDIVEVVDVDDDDSVILLEVVANGKVKNPSNGAVFKVGGKSSRRATTIDRFYCTICTETVSGIQRFPVAGCAHAFCASCVGQYIAARVEQNLLSVGCPDPGCKGGVLHPEDCRRVIPPPLFDRWGAALCEAALPGELKFYCPFKDCSALLVDDTSPGDAAAVLTNVECPHCNRLFCARCKVPWHDGVQCAEFQRLGEDERGRDDLLLRKVAQQRRWGRCPRCRMYVEKVSGCDSMRCR
jgi:E3 ubiquitin-protein ligase RNF144